VAAVAAKTQAIQLLAMVVAAVVVVVVMQLILVVRAGSPEVVAVMVH
jgi:hypothetical protein